MSLKHNGAVADSGQLLAEIRQNKLGCAVVEGIHLQRMKRPGCA